jgi:hypothetical protein
MQYDVFDSEGGRYWLFDLASDPDPERCCKVERFAPGGYFLGGAGIYGDDGAWQAADPEGWFANKILRIGSGDEGHLAQLLDWLLAVRGGRIDPVVTAPPCPPRGRVVSGRPEPRH